MPVRETIAPKELIEGLKVMPKYVGKNRMDYIVDLPRRRGERILGRMGKRLAKQKKL